MRGDQRAFLATFNSKIPQSLIELNLSSDPKLLNIFLVSFDGSVKSLFCPIFVIPAKAGIQLIQAVLDSCFRRSDGFETFYESINSGTREPERINGTQSRKAPLAFLAPWREIERKSCAVTS